MPLFGSLTGWSIPARWRTPLAGAALLGGVGVAMLAGVSLYLLRVADARLHSTAEAVREDDEARGQLLRLGAAFQDALSAERGYLLTGDRGLLAPLQTAEQQLDRTLTALATYPAWSPSGRTGLAALGAGIHDTTAQLDRAIALHDTGHAEAAIAAVPASGRDTPTERIGARIATVTDALNDQQRADADAHAAEEQAALTLAIGGSALAALMLLTAGIIVLMQVRAHHQRELVLLAGRNAAEAANRAKSRFLGAVSHDLRQPLHAITLFVAALRRRTDGDEVDSIVDNIAVATGAMQRMFTALLDVARLDAGAVVVQPRSFALDEVLHALRTKFAPFATAKGLLLEITDSHLFVLTDAALLESVLHNLLANAVAYTAHGSVTLTAHRHGQALELEVRDTGPGIAADRLGRIFGEFVHLEHADPAGHGVGLGLAIVRMLADLLGARIEVTSVPGTGSVFTVRLPYVPGAIEPPPPSHDEPAPDLAGLRILVLDDDPLVLRATATEVADWGAQPILVLSAVDAMAVMARMVPDAPDAAIIDQDIIGEVSGVGLLDRIAARYGVALPSVIVTGATSASVREELSDSGHPWLLKPADPATLRRMLADAVIAGRRPPSRPALSEG
jgi:signal transduction histidine kinase